MDRECSSIVVGVDLGDRSSVVSVLDVSTGEIVSESSVRTTPAAFEAHFRALRPCRAGMEAGTHSPWAARLLRSIGHEVVVAHPRRLRAISENVRKCDSSDAQTLARMVATPGLLAATRVRSEPDLSAQALVRTRIALVRSRARLVLEARGLVKTAGGRLRGSDPEQLPRTAWDDAPTCVRDVVRVLLSGIADLTNRLAETDALVAKACAARPHVARLAKVYGIGELTALAFVLTVGEPHRFQDVRDAAAFLGLVPARDQSGARDRSLGISKQGDGEVRRLLVQCAHVIMARRAPDSALRRFGLKTAARGGAGAKKKAAVAVARKLAVLLCSLWKSGEAYEPLRGCRVATPAA